jgi:acetolactate decarboxylase
MKRLLPLLILALLLAAPLLAQPPVASYSSPPLVGKDVLFQVASFTALLNGNYDGVMSCGDLRAHGDFGLGAGNALDGEMVEVGGKFYRVRTDGKVYPVADQALTPFACTVFFHPTITRTLPDPLADLAALGKAIDALRPAGLPCAVRITGDFDYVKTRSLPLQTKPYPRLADVVKIQTTFELRHVSGVMVGFWFPADFSGLNVAGYHLHFLTADRTAGGHVLEAQPHHVTVELDPLRQYQLVLPATTTGATGDNDQTETQQVEH